MLTAGDLEMTPLEQRLVGRYGSLLLVQQGVRLLPGGPILGVVNSYTPLGPTTELAAADTRSIIEFLAVGLFIFWAAPLPAGCGRIACPDPPVDCLCASRDRSTS